MAIRNIVLRIASLAVSVLFALYVKYVYSDPDTVSVNIMLTTLLFSILRSGFSFDRLSKSQSNIKTSSYFTIDKFVLLILVLVYSQYMGMQIGNFVYALFSASVITIIYIRQYTGYTKGRLLSSLLVSLVFPVQVITNLSLNYFHPGMVFIIVGVMLVLYMSFDQCLYKSERMGRAEVYYSMLLPVGGFSAISIDGIDKPVYMLVSKIIDSIGSILGFVIQGNLKGTRKYIERYNVMLPFMLLAAVLFIVGGMFYMLKPVNEYLVISVSIFINMIWFIYSVFTIVSMVKHGEAALTNISNQIKCLSIIFLGLYLTGVFEPIYITIALSISFICSMLMSRSVYCREMHV